LDALRKQVPLRDFAGVRIEHVRQEPERPFDVSFELISGSNRIQVFGEIKQAPSPKMLAEIGPCFRDDGRRTDTVVLACTHYPLLMARLEQIAPWPVNFIDPAPAIARRVAHLLEGMAALADKGGTHAIFTSGSAPAVILARFGMRAHQRA